jgi:exosome complex component RRP40
LRLLGEHFPFEIAVGLNGRVWVDAGKPGLTILVANAISASEHMTPGQIDKLVKTLVQKSPSL